MSSDGSGRIAVSLGPAPIPLAGPLRVRRSATITGALRSGLRILDLSDTPGPGDRVGVRSGRRGGAVGGPDRRRGRGPCRASRESGAGAGRGRPPERRGPGERSRAEPGIRGRFSELGAAEAGIVAAVSAGARWVAVPGSLLAAPRLLSLGLLARRAGAEPPAYEPSRRRAARRTLVERRPRHRLPADAPVDFREIERAYAPVLALRFLTESRRRTLPQAAVAFAWAIGAIPSVRFRDLAQVAAFGRPLEIAPIADAELERLSHGDLPRGAD